MHSRDRVANLAAFIFIVVALSLILVGSALGAPNEPTLGLTPLKAKLDAAPDGMVDGYFKTVVKGSTITTIPLNVLAITGSESPDGALILFEATGKLIGTYGGIVEGMSGSPIYVSDGGEDKVIGAVSYGDEFTTGGVGLATPIEAMTNLEDSHPPQVQELSRPMMTSSGVIDSIILAPNPGDFAGAAAQGAFVAKPLATMFVGGANTQSHAFSWFEKALAEHGVSLVSQGASVGSFAQDDTSLQTPLVAGATVAEAARHDHNLQRHRVACHLPRRGPPSRRLHDSR